MFKPRWPGSFNSGHTGSRGVPGHVGGLWNGAQVRYQHVSSTARSVGSEAMPNGALCTLCVLAAGVDRVQGHQGDKCIDVHDRRHMQGGVWVGLSLPAV